jgi:hypothetical protein
MVANSRLMASSDFGRLRTGLRNRAAAPMDAEGVEK